VLRDLQPDVVVSDVGLPDGNGADFCLDNAAELPHARWLVMSAQPELLHHVRDLAERLDRPAFSVFDKPVPLQALDDIIRLAAPAMPPMRSSTADGQLDHVP
jgi:DNA-binding NarL/FixJ family response regulator